MTIIAPPPIETKTQSPLGEVVPITRHAFAPSPLNRRRWQNFKSNRRGYWSFWIFLILFFVSLFAELIANDRPFLIKFDGRLYWPAFVSYSETTFGGDFETAADYRAPYLQKLIADQGRDGVAALIYGFPISVLFGLSLTIISSIIGVAAGGVQGYFGGWIDLAFQRFIEVWTAIPSLYLLLILSSVLVPGFFVLLGILLLFSWVALVHLVRAEFLRGRNFEYIQAARALGVSNRTIMFRHLLPNAMVATMTFLPFIMSSSVSALTSLDFLGFGLPPGSPSLGEMLSQAKANVQAPWLGIAGFLTVATMLSLLIFVGEAVRDAFDPRKTRGGADGGKLREIARGQGSVGRVPSRSKRDSRRRSRLLFDQEGRDRRARRRIRIGQVGDGPLGLEASALSCSAPPIRFHPVQEPGASRVERG